jgi:hypothetical protein
LAVQADRGRATIGVVVNFAVTVVVPAVADLRSWPHAAHAGPAVRALALKVPRLAFALQGSTRGQTGGIAGAGRRGHAIVDASVAVVILSVAHLGRGTNIVAHDVPAHARADPLLTFADGAAAGHANPGHAIVRLINQPVAIIVNAVADLGRGNERADRTLHVLAQGVADVLTGPLAGLGVAWQAQIGEVFVYAAIAVVVLAVAQLLGGRHRAHAGQLAPAGDGVGLARWVPKGADANALSARHVTADGSRGVARRT